MFKKGSIITLEDDNEYSVVDHFSDSGNTYVYLIDINNIANIIYGKLENDKIIELKDPDELEEVIKIVNSHLHSN